jgi:peptide/nickel transport system permease protein
MFIVSIIVFLATQALPGNAAYASLGQQAVNLQRLHAVERQLHLNRSAMAQYWSWLSGLLTGHLGNSLATHQPIWHAVGPELANSATLVVVAGLIGTVLGIGLGALASLRKDGVFDHVLAVVSLAVTSLPSFVVAIAFIIVFATLFSHLLPAVSILPPGTYAWQEPRLLVLPVATLVAVIVPYISRMTRASMIEALESDYTEMAELKGLSRLRVVLVHALPNAIAPVIQVVGISFLYLAGGIVVVEDIFNFPGIGQGLVNAISGRDIPTLQFIVMVLAAFFVFVNIVCDVVTLLGTPRRRIAR